MRALALLVVGTALIAAGCGSGDRPAPPRAPAPEPAPLTSAALRDTLRTPALVEHLERFGAIARANGGNRAAGTKGADASIDYVAERLRRAGYAVERQAVSFPFFEERRRPRVEAGGRRLASPEQVRTLAYSSGGEVEGPVAAVRGLGCAPGDHAAVARGAVAVVARGECTLRRKARLAQAAGAAAVLIVNQGGTFPGTLGRPGVRIPVLGASDAAGAVLRRTRRVAVRVDAVSERRRTENVLAQTRGGTAAGTVMLGAHLDSVPEGPGINDNATGVATTLGIAEGLARLGPPERRVRFAFWGAEELGLYGSRHYVRTLPRVGRRQIGAYINLDMTGSPNPVRLVYDGDRGPSGSARVERVLRAHFRARGLSVGETRLRGGSDHAPFLRAGIPVGGLFTGAGARKSEAQARRFGGRAGRPLDPCYHRACDTVRNVDRRVLGQMAGAAAHAVATLAR